MTAIETRMTSHQRFFAEAECVQRHEVTIEPSFSDQKKRDLIRTLNNAWNIIGEDAPAGSLRAHLLEYFTSFDGRLEWPMENHIEKFHEPNWPSIIANLSPQRASSMEFVEALTHGYLPIQGTVALAKSYFSRLHLAGGLDNPDIKFIALMTQESNKGVDELALEMKKLLDQHGIKNKPIIRLGSLPTEKTEYIGQKIQPTYATNSMVIDQQEAHFFINGVLNFAGKAADAIRTKGDKRFTDACRNLSLHAAMYQKLQREKGSNALYAALLTDMEYIAENPNDDSDRSRPGLRWCEVHGGIQWHRIRNWERR